MELEMEESRCRWAGGKTRGRFTRTRVRFMRGGGGDGGRHGLCRRVETLKTHKYVGGCEQREYVLAGNQKCHVRIAPSSFPFLTIPPRKCVAICETFLTVFLNVTFAQLGQHCTRVFQPILLNFLDRNSSRQICTRIWRATHCLEKWYHIICGCIVDLKIRDPSTDGREHFANILRIVQSRNYYHRPYNTRNRKWRIALLRQEFLPRVFMCYISRARI